MPDDRREGPSVPDWDVADLPEPLPPHLHPGTKEPVGPDDLAPLFPSGLIAQEVSPERFIEIPEPVRDIYRLWRPSPLYRAHGLERALGTPARIYYKYEGVSPAGSHKPNTAVPQAYYNARAGIRKLTTETGAGQWGTALAFACAQWTAGGRSARIAGWLGAVGGLIFCLALALIAFLSAPAFGAVAPIGGLLMIAAAVVIFGNVLVWTV